MHIIQAWFIRSSGCFSIMCILCSVWIMSLLFSGVFVTRSNPLSQKRKKQNKIFVSVMFQGETFWSLFLTKTNWKQNGVWRNTEVKDQKHSLDFQFSKGWFWSWLLSNLNEVSNHLISHFPCTTTSFPSHLPESGLGTQTVLDQCRHHEKYPGQAFWCSCDSLEANRCKRELPALWPLFQDQQTCPLPGSWSYPHVSGSFVYKLSQRTKLHFFPSACENTYS